MLNRDKLYSWPYLIVNKLNPISLLNKDRLNFVLYFIRNRLYSLSYLINLVFRRLHEK